MSHVSAQQQGTLNADLEVAASYLTAAFPGRFPRRLETAQEMVDCFNSARSLMAENSESVVLAELQGALISFVVQREAVRRRP